MQELTINTTRSKSDMIKIMAIVRKNLKIKLRDYQTYIYSFGFPLMFTFLFYFLFGTEDIGGGYTIFDIAISGMLIYAASFGTINAAGSLTEEKHNGTLMRLDTTSTKRSTVFLATVLSESVFLTIQIIVMFIVGYVVLGLHWFNDNPLLLIVGFFIILIYGVSTLGIGIIISAYAKTAEASVGLSLMYVMPITFLSGAFYPFASNIQYFLPPFWANAIYRQVVVLGYDFFSGFIQIPNANPLVLEYTVIPIWGGFLIIIGILIISILIGIYLFQKKTLR
jgi:ABC-type transport system involved in multi-copper enzyme maturation permease subunit